MALTRIKPSGIDLTQNYSVNQLSANTVLDGGVEIIALASAAYGTANSAFAAANAAGSSSAVVAAGAYANGAFTAANTAQGTADAAFIQANTATTNAASADGKATSAFLAANTVSGTVTSSFLAANTAQGTATAAFIGANNAWTQSNTAYTSATSAYTQSTLALGNAQAAFNQANTDYTTLSTTAGIFGGSSNIPVITLAANGRVSSIVNTAISIPAGTSVYGNTGQITANSATGTVALGLATTAVTPGSYTSTSLTVDAYGRITAASSGAGGGGGVSLTNDTSTNLNTYYPLLSYNATSGSLSTANTSSTKLYFNPSTGTLNSTIFNSLSDKNFKTDLEQITDALDKLKTLTGYTYSMIDSGERSAGLLSQDVSQVLPEAVKENNGTQSLNYNATIGLIVESIKILSDKIDLINKKLG